MVCSACAATKIRIVDNLCAHQVQSNSSAGSHPVCCPVCVGQRSRVRRTPHETRPLTNARLSILCRPAPPFRLDALSPSACEQLAKSTQRRLEHDPQYTTAKLSVSGDNEWGIVQLDRDEICNGEGEARVTTVLVHLPSRREVK